MGSQGENRVGTKEDSKATIRFLSLRDWQKPSVKKIRGQRQDM
jgi:hypothetical protein